MLSEPHCAHSTSFPKKVCIRKQGPSATKVDRWKLSFATAGMHEQIVNADGRSSERAAKLALLVNNWQLPRVSGCKYSMFGGHRNDAVVMYWQFGS